EDCYRSYNQQKAAYDRRCPVVETPMFSVDPETGEKTQIGVDPTRECNGPPLAPPGASNHGWGRAVDFTDQRGTLTCYDEEFDWLRNNAHRFGWVHPPWARCGLVSQEPWHWEWAGVTDQIQVPLVTPTPDLIPPPE
ncbi:MAG TPA: M15 family metallopeptidase, partial [Acidimicrobiia bacterium]|nr:M15 family metallopeptidase [Acidimicrobiia bacterium]